MRHQITAARSDAPQIPKLGFCLFVRGESGISRNHSGNERILSHRIHFVVDSFEEIVWRCVPRWVDKAITEGVSCLMRDGFGWCLESLRDAPSSQSLCLAMPEQSDPLTNDLSGCCAVSNFISTTVLNTLRGGLTSILAPCRLSSWRAVEFHEIKTNWSKSNPCSTDKNFTSL